jgi:hypothetical protein
MSVITRGKLEKRKLTILSIMNLLILLIFGLNYFINIFYGEKYSNPILIIGFLIIIPAVVFCFQNIGQPINMKTSQAYTIFSRILLVASIACLFVGLLFFIRYLWLTWR